LVDLIIDGHTHLIDPPYIPEQLKFKIADGQIMKPDALRTQVTPEKLLQAMDEHQIDKAIAIASNALSNEVLSGIVKKHPNRLKGFAYIHPLDFDSKEQLEKAVNQMGLVGLKLVPDFQDFSMGDSRIYQLLEKAVELGVPVMVHSAPGLIKGHFNQSLPEHFDAIKKEIPELVLIISHLCYPKFLDLLNIVPNDGVFVDTSTTLPWIVDLYGVDFTSRFIHRIGADSVIFGSDWWGKSSEMKKQIDSIMKMDLTQKEKEMILGGNISNILNL
jgi:predicted TIM-barrel fold metal-dependent hydrolase